MCNKEYFGHSNTTKSNSKFTTVIEPKRKMDHNGSRI